MQTTSKNPETPDLETKAGDFFQEYTEAQLWDNLADTMNILETSPDYTVMSTGERADLSVFIIRTYELLHCLHATYRPGPH